MRTHTRVDSPVGPLTLVAEEGVLCGLYMDSHTHAPGGSAIGPPATSGFEAVIEQLGEYFAGDRTTFEVVLRFSGSRFQQDVWRALRDIPYGTTESYGALAARLGRPGSARAVGLANGRNPISVIVPCHRVIGADGSLTGFGGGLERKRLLLELESPARPLPL